MEKVYTSQNVHEAFLERLSFLLDEFDTLYVSFSGGKDSGLLLSLVMDNAGSVPGKRIGLFHQDFEAQFRHTTEYVERTFQRYGDDCESYWCCLPMASKTNLSMEDAWWYPWDPDCKERWARPLPSSPFVVSLENNPFGFYRMKMEQSRFYKGFGKWWQDKHGGKSCALIGMRADESLSRYSAVVNKKDPYKGRHWITRNSADTFTAYPLYDWTVEDVWTAYGRFGYDYNRLYDLYAMAGLPPKKMRVSSPFNEWATKDLRLYKEIDPEMWDVLSRRVPGACFGALYGNTAAMGNGRVILPEGHTWDSYAAFLLETVPERERARYAMEKDPYTRCRMIMANSTKGAKRSVSKRKGNDNDERKRRLREMMMGGKAK